MTKNPLILAKYAAYLQKIGVRRALFEQNSVIDI